MRPRSVIVEGVSHLAISSNPDHEIEKTPKSLRVRPTKFSLAGTPHDTDFASSHSKKLSYILRKAYQSNQVAQRSKSVERLVQIR